MKTSQLIIKAQDQNISAVELTPRDTNCELALVSLDVLRQLLNAHAITVSLRELKENMITSLEECSTIGDYKKILSYDLQMLAIHDNLKAYDDEKFKQTQAAIKADLDANSVQLR